MFFDRNEENEDLVDYHLKYSCLFLSSAVVFLQEFLLVLPEKLPLLMPTSSKVKVDTS